MINKRLLLPFLCAIAFGAASMTPPPALARHHASRTKTTQSPVNANSDADSEATTDGAAAENQSAEANNTEQASSASSDSASDDTGANRSANPQGVSLFSIVTGAGMMWFGIAGLLCFLAVSHVMIPAMVWHSGNVFRGGKKPTVG